MTKARPGLTEDEKREHVLALNLARRHLTPTQRKEIEVRLKLEGWSNTRIAEVLGVSEGTVRNDLATSQNYEVALPARTIGKDGKERPAHRPAPIMAPSREAALKSGPAPEPKKWPCPRCGKTWLRVGGQCGLCGRKLKEHEVAAK